MNIPIHKNKKQTTTATERILLNDTHKFNS